MSLFSAELCYNTCKNVSTITSKVSVTKVQTTSINSVKGWIQTDSSSSLNISQANTAILAAKVSIGIDVIAQQLTQSSSNTYDIVVICDMLGLCNKSRDSLVDWTSIDDISTWVRTKSIQLTNKLSTDNDIIQMLELYYTTYLEDNVLDVSNLIVNAKNNISTCVTAVQSNEFKYNYAILKNNAHVDINMSNTCMLTVENALTAATKQSESDINTIELDNEYVSNLKAVFSKNRLLSLTYDTNKTTAEIHHDETSLTIVYNNYPTLEYKTYTADNAEQQSSSNSDYIYDHYMFYHYPLTYSYKYNTNNERILWLEANNKNVTKEVSINDVQYFKILSNDIVVALFNNKFYNTNIKLPSECTEEELYIQESAIGVSSSSNTNNLNTNNSNTNNSTNTTSTEHINTITLIVYIVICILFILSIITLYRSMHKQYDNNTTVVEYQ